MRMGWGLFLHNLKNVKFQMVYHLAMPVQQIFSEWEFAGDFYCYLCGDQAYTHSTQANLCLKKLNFPVDFGSYRNWNSKTNS